MPILLVGETRFMVIVPSLKFPLRRPKIYLFISIITRITIYFKKRGEGRNFDTAMGAYDVAEICELVGNVLLYSINKIVDPSSHGLYDNDGLIIVDKSTPKKCDGISKGLHRLFGEFGFKLDTQTDLKIADYLDVTLNLYNGTVSPFRKRNQDLRYVDRGSNHPIQVFKHIPKGIEHRLSNNSSNKEIFERSKQEYEETLKKILKNDGYRIKLEYRDRERSNTQKRRNRPRKILWFSPPDNMEVVNNLGKEFFKLLKRNFPSGNPLYKIFNKNCVKLSYSCMPNINGIINKSNIAKLSKEKNKVIAKCNCRDKVRCPLEGKCKQEYVVYKVEVYSYPSNDRNKKVYFRSIQGEFKARYYNHKTSFSQEKYMHSTTLSSYVWEVKDKKGIDPILKWEVIKKCHKYRAGDRDCMLCVEEKIASCKSRDMLNQRSEVLDSCKHKRGWLLYN